MNVIHHTRKKDIRQEILKITRKQSVEREEIEVDWSLFPKEIERYAKNKGLELGIEPIVPAIMCFAAFGSAWMSHFQFCFEDYSPCPISFNLLLIAESSYGKSSCAAPLFSIFSEQQERENESFLTQRKSFETAKFLFLKKIELIYASKLEEQEKTLVVEKLQDKLRSLAVPKKRKYKIEDVNMASFCDAMRTNARSAMTWYSEEASSIFMSTEFKKNTSVFCRNFIAMMSNTPLHFERTTVEKDSIQNVAVNAVFLIQTKVFEDVYTGPVKTMLQHGGFFNRFVIIHGEKRGEVDKSKKRIVRKQEKELADRIKEILELKERHKLHHRILPHLLNKQTLEETEATLCDASSLDRKNLLLSDKIVEKMEARIDELLHDPSNRNDESYAKKLYIDVGNIASILFLIENEAEMMHAISKKDEDFDDYGIADGYGERAIEIATLLFKLKRLVLNDDIRTQEKQENIEMRDYEIFAEVCYKKYLKFVDTTIKDELVINLTSKSLVYFPVIFRGKVGMQKTKIACQILVALGLLGEYNVDKMRFTLPMFDLFYPKS